MRAGMRADSISQLVDLLVEIFGTTERLERFLRHSISERPDLAGFSKGLEIRRAAIEAADELRRRGLLDGVFFDRLRDYAPRLASDVEKLRGEILVDIESWQEPPEDAPAPRSPKVPSVFITYARADRSLYLELLTHLTVLERRGTIELWEEGRISAGDRWNDVLRRELGRADIILLLVSADFLASDYIQAVGMREAMRRQASGEARVIPIIARPCEWQGSGLENLQALPAAGRPVTTFEDTDSAWVEVVQTVVAVARVGREG